MADLDKGRLEDQVKNLSSEVSLARTYLDRQAFDSAVGAIEKRLDAQELIVPTGYVETALKAEAHDPAVVQAFDNRGQDPKTFARTMRKLQDKIVAAAKAMPDREVTADKMAVAAAMRGASTNRMPEAPKPNYGKMTDAEFSKAKQDLGLE